MKPHMPNVGIVTALAVAMAVAVSLRADPETTKKTEKTMSTEQTSEQDLKSKLTPLQYRVAVECGTEPAFRNEYWNNHREGLYVSIISGKPLFSSHDKFDSGTGWPSFTKPIDPKNIIEKTDRSYGMIRTEVVSKSDNAHLGHVFDDGPGPGGQRYCINSASLRFVPVEKLTEEGYGDFLPLFGKPESAAEKK